MIHVHAPESGQVVCLEAALQPLHLAFIDAPDETVMQCRVCRSDEYWLGADFNGACASGGGEGIRSDDEMNMERGVHRSQKCRCHGAGWEE